MRIALLSPAHPLRGGIAASSERLAQQLQLMGHEVMLYSFKLQYPECLFPGKTQYTDDPPPAQLRIQPLIHSVNPLNWPQSARHIRNWQPQIVLARYWLPFIAPSLGSILRLVGKGPVRLALIDNALPHERRLGDQVLTRWFLHSIDGALVMSDAVAADLASLHFDKPIRQAPHPVYDHYGAAIPRGQALQQLHLPTDAQWLLFFGFIRPYKGLDLAIYALASPVLRKHPKLKLLVAGESYTNLEEYRALARALGVANRIVWHTHYIPTEEVKYYFCAADLVVQPYKSATQSGITQIAFHFAKPMVVTRVGGLPEMVPHEQAGLVVAPDAQAIAQAIDRYFSDPDLVHRLEHGVRQIAARYTWSHLVHTLLALSCTIRPENCSEP